MPSLPNVGMGRPVACAEGDHLVARRHVDDSLVFTVSPVRQAASGEPPRRRLAALAFVQAVHPLHLAGCGIQGDNRAPGAGRRIEDAVGHERRGLQVELGLRPQVVGLEPPRDFEVPEIAGVDLIERRVPRVGEVRRRRSATRRQVDARRTGRSPAPWSRWPRAPRPSDQRVRREVRPRDGGVVS